MAARGKGGRVYRYYVSAALQSGGRRGEAELLRLSAPTLEARVMDSLLLVVPEVTGWTEARALLNGLEVDGKSLTLVLSPSAKPRLRGLPDDINVNRMADGSVRIEVPFAPRAWRGAATVVRGSVERARRGRVDRALVNGLAKAHALIRIASSGPNMTFDRIAAASGIDEAYVRRLAPLAFLAPDIQRAILDGTQPGGMMLERLVRTGIPLCWKAQRQAFGFEEAQGYAAAAA